MTPCGTNLEQAGNQLLVMVNSLNKLSLPQPFTTTIHAQKIKYKCYMNEFVSIRIQHIQKILVWAGTLPVNIPLVIYLHVMIELLCDNDLLLA